MGGWVGACGCGCGCGCGGVCVYIFYKTLYLLFFSLDCLFVFVSIQSNPFDVKSNERCLF